MPPPCPTCYKRHLEECWLRETVFYQRYQTGHIARDCQAPHAIAFALRPYRGGHQEPHGGHQRNAILTQVYALTLGDAEVAGDIVTGKTHSFIAREFVKLCGFETQQLGVSLSVATPTGVVGIFQRVIQNCLMIIQGRYLSADLVVLELHGFEVILGMDWLVAHYASIDCHQRGVVFRPPRE
ncbi:uncharacterized protein LOC131162702 [Malania oleifera]|uniref:uncharacterized protein LOC131162702 n=1 Tax=Malania oleifera TaxID=397392 RepID=UPI0025AE9FBE|nr:uncharacterized protein LOC131162702 [Malania oleifera]